ncbi:MAG: anti-repressor SinI family protein [Bacillota bacterium]
MEKVVFNLTENLDKEWVELIGDALDMGISTDEIRDFLYNNTNSSFKNL